MGKCESSPTLSRIHFYIRRNADQDFPVAILSTWLLNSRHNPVLQVANQTPQESQEQCRTILTSAPRQLICDEGFWRQLCRGSGGKLEQAIRNLM